VCNSQ